MAKYDFVAKDLSGRKIKGSIDAESEQELRVKLRAKQLIPISATVSSGKNAKVAVEVVGDKELQIFTRQLSVLIDAGVPIVQSIEAMLKGGRTPAFLRVLNQVVQDLETGSTLAQAFGKHPRCFDRMYVSLIRAGEEGGVLEQVLQRLAEYLEKTMRLKNKVKSAMWYPAIILVVAMIVIAAILTFVIPSFVEIFNDVGQELPALTAMVISVSDWFKSYWYIVFAFLIGAPILMRAYYRTNDGRKFFDNFFIEAPLLGSLVQKSSIARFSRTLASLFSSGVRVLDALDIAGATCGNFVIEEVLIQSKEFVSKGRLLSEPLSESKHIPAMVTQMIAVGEQTGNMDVMLNKVADFYEDEVESAADALTSIIEPVMMIFLGGIIAVLVVSLYLPIFNLAGTIGG